VLGAVGYFNVWPKAHAILEKQLDASNWSGVELQVFQNFLVSQIWPAIRKAYAQPWHWSWPGGLIVVLVTFGFGLVAFNTIFAIDSLGIQRDSDANKNASTIEKKAEWTKERDGLPEDWVGGKDGVGGKLKDPKNGGGEKGERIQLQAERHGLKFTSTSKAVLDTTKKDFADAEWATTTASNDDCRSRFGSWSECNRVRREYDQRHQKLVQVEADAAIQNRADKLDARIKELGKDITDLTTKIDDAGPVPEHKDALAWRIGNRFNWTEDEAAERLPEMQGAFAEFCALLGPLVLDLAFAFLAGQLMGARRE
jgi:hypothetical protein